MKLRDALRTLFAATMILAGVVHLAKPAIYTPFFPPWAPGLLIVYLSGVVEILVGAAALVPRTRGWGTLGILVLMVLYLPLHVLDVFAEHPVIGSPGVAYVRLPLQFVLIAWAWAIRERPPIARGRHGDRSAPGPESVDMSRT